LELIWFPDLVIGAGGVMPVLPSESELREELDGGVNGCSGMFYLNICIVQICNFKL